ncbi:MAG: AAA family ATPase [Desulfobacterales bacterium]|jgi:endopeptidase Clp ATP-binding regulatory subunit ClpX
MKSHDEKIPDPKELEKEIGEFLSKKFGHNVKIVTPVVLPEQNAVDQVKSAPKSKKDMNFDLKPEELIAYLDQFVVKQDSAKAILATKICTHFNRIRRARAGHETSDSATKVGNIKNNVLMIGPTGVGKTYVIKLIAAKLGVPFVKGDATKFSETGYVGGDVEDLVRELVREADEDIELAECGIIYIDEIDKIASSRNTIGADVSRTGVQRALLKPMEETEVDLKVPHDPISMIQEIERFRKTGKREKQSVNTANILFIMSGAFTDLEPIIRKRLTKQEIGFGARIDRFNQSYDVLAQVKSEDLIRFGFETEFVGRLPVRAVFENLSEQDLYEILKNPNNPIILGKKLDFAAYDIEIKFEDQLLRMLAQQAFTESTGARGLVSAVEKTLLEFEKKLPSTQIRKFPATMDIIKNPQPSIKTLTRANDTHVNDMFENLDREERQRITRYLDSNKAHLENKYNLMMTPSRVHIVAQAYAKNIMDIESVVKQIKNHYDDIKKMELQFYKNHDMNIVLEEDAIDFIMEQLIQAPIDLKNVYQKIDLDFKHGLKLAREKTGRSRFFITRQALLDPEAFISQMIQSEFDSDSRVLNG